MNKFNSSNVMMYGIMKPDNDEPNEKFIKNIEKPKECSIEEYTEELLKKQLQDMTDIVRKREKELILRELKNKILKLKRYDPDFDPRESLMEENDTGEYVKFCDVMRLFS